MSPDLPRSPHWVEVDFVGDTCSSIKLAKQSVFYLYMIIIICNVIELGMMCCEFCTREENSSGKHSHVFGTMSQNSRKGHMEGERSPIVLDGVSL